MPGILLNSEILTPQMCFVLAERFGEVAVAAGGPIMDVYGVARVEMKEDGSPVTEADRAAEAVILSQLHEMIPEIPVVSEEQVAEWGLPGECQRFVLVDPLDGTKEFVRRSGEFSVNIALVDQGRAVAGAIYAPVLGRLWIGAGGRAEVMAIKAGEPLIKARQRRTISVRLEPPHLTAMVSVSHFDAPSEAFLEKLPIGSRRAVGSSMKFGLIAEGQGDIYPRLGGTMEWDTAAGQAIIEAAGGCVLSPQGGALHYGKWSAGLRNDGFIALGSVDLPGRYPQAFAAEG